MSKETNQIIEVGGVKLEVDMRYARVVENYQLGAKVKVLIKGYGDSYTTHPGVIVGFDNFKERPCIVIAYAKSDYNGTDISIAYLTKDTKDLEICPMVQDELKFSQAEALAGFDRAIANKMGEVKLLEEKRAYFLERFGQYFALPE